MDIDKMLAELRAERETVEQAIVTLQRLAAGCGRRRECPPKWMTAVKRRGRPPGSKEKPKSDYKFRAKLECSELNILATYTPHRMVKVCIIWFAPVSGQAASGPFSRRLSREP
jgi:hypothetical protein